MGCFWVGGENVWHFSHWPTPMLHVGKTDWAARDGSDFGYSLKEVGDRMIAETVFLTGDVLGF